MWRRFDREMISKKASDRVLDAFFEFGNVVIAVQKKHLLSVHLNFLATFFCSRYAVKTLFLKTANAMIKCKNGR